MNQAVIIDVVLLAVLAAAFVLGARRGLFKSLAGLAVLLVSLVCAIIISNALTAPVMEIIHPMLEQKITEKLDEAMAEPEIPALESGEEESSVWQEAWRLLKGLGLGDHQAGSLAGRVEEQVKETGQAVATAVVESFLSSVIRAVLFLLTFVVVTLALRMVVMATNFVLRLPGLRSLNALGGGLFGLGEGVLVLFLAVWLLEQFGVDFRREMVESTYLLQFFVTKSPLDLLTSL